LEALVAITYRCNAKCYMCNTWQYPSKVSEEISIKDIEKLPSNLSFINITGGEPFIRKDIQEIVYVLKKKAKRVVISTNGFFSDLIVDLAKNNKDIGIRVSLEGLPKANDELRGIKNGFDKGLRTILQLKEMGLKDIGFGITISDKNAKDIMELYTLAKSIDLEFATAIVHNGYYFHKYDNAIIDKQLITKEVQKLIDDLLKSKRIKNWFRAYFNFGIINYVNGGKRLLPCEMGSNIFFVDPFGEIKPCNAMDESMGSIKTSSFDDIWRSEKAENVRKLVKTCQKNCWMIGSVSPQMKKYISIPARWILQNKFRKG